MELMLFRLPLTFIPSLMVVLLLPTWGGRSFSAIFYESWSSLRHSSGTTSGLSAS